MITKHGKLKNAQGFSNVHATRKFRAIKHSGIWTRQNGSIRNKTASKRVKQFAQGKTLNKKSFKSGSTRPKIRFLGQTRLLFYEQSVFLYMVVSATRT